MLDRAPPRQVDSVKTRGKHEGVFEARAGLVV